MRVQKTIVHNIVPLINNWEGLLLSEEELHSRTGLMDLLKAIWKVVNLVIQRQVGAG